MAEPDPSVTARARLTAILIRAALFALLWWTLTEGALDAPGPAAVAVAAAVAVSLRVLPPGTAGLAPAALAAFAGFFLWQSLRGGLAVARLALHPRLRLRPRLWRVPLKLPPGMGRVILANTISLLPGTLSVGFEDDSLQVHVLDEALLSEAELDTAQRKVARLVGVP